ncbi:purine-nucleoside phosphorylase [Candidatus Bipolaricaulota bacterium]|nr:purine-nucleoside phosphorylase [Candidatus Bipolaricaulota bacterium]
MSIHIGAKQGEIAPTVLLPGDPRRAKLIAETFLQDAVCFSEVRGMLGYTGRHEGRQVSVMGTGMGIPSASIYIHELLSEYHVNTLIRVGTCGALQPHLNIGDLVLAMAASTDSHVNRLRFHGMDFAPTADFRLLLSAFRAAESMEADVHVGSVFSSDTFYDDDPEAWKSWAAFGVLAVEMETAGLYTLAAKFGARALAVLTVSDSLVHARAASADEREQRFMRMAEIALACSNPS